MYYVMWNLLLNFYLSHWEKYNTGVLFLPWGYDFSMWVGSFFFVHILTWFEHPVYYTKLLTILPLLIFNLLQFKSLCIRKKTVINVIFNIPINNKAFFANTF